jgi:hypothetical protein
MTQMTNTQREAIREAHAYRIERPNGQRDGHVRTASGARNRMITRMIQARVLDESGRVTLAGLTAAGVLDAIHGEALREQAVRESMEAEANQQTPAYRWFVAAVRQGKSYRAALDILHAEALAEVPTVSRADPYADPYAEREASAPFNINVLRGLLHGSPLDDEVRAAGLGALDRIERALRSA